MTLLYALPVVVLVGARLARRRRSVVVGPFETVSTFHSTLEKRRPRSAARALDAASELLD